MLHVARRRTTAAARCRGSQHPRAADIRTSSRRAKRAGPSRELAVTGLFIWPRIDDQRQRCFVTATGTGRAASTSPQISRAGCAQTAVSACAVAARRRCCGGLSRCVTECSSPSGIVGGLLTVGSAPWTVDGVWLARCPRLRRGSFSTDVPDNVSESHTAACPFPGPRHASQSDVPDNRPLSLHLPGGSVGAVTAQRDAGPTNRLRARSPRDEMPSTAADGCDCERHPDHHDTIVQWPDGHRYKPSALQAASICYTVAPGLLVRHDVKQDDRGPPF